MDLLERPAPLPLRRSAPRAIDITPRRGSLWRVTRSDGSILGYVERVTDSGGPQYRSKRLIGRAATFDVLGEFPLADDAIDALRG